MQLLFTGAFPARLFCADSSEQKGISVAASRPACCVTVSSVRSYLQARFSECGLALLALQKAFCALNTANAHLPYKYLLIYLTGNWITTRSAVLKMGHSGLCATWKCCKYSLYILLVARAQYLGITNVKAYLRAAA